MVLPTALQTLGTTVALSADMSTMKAYKAATRLLQNLLPGVGVADNFDRSWTSALVDNKKAVRHWIQT